MKLRHIYVFLLALNLAGFPLVAGVTAYLGLPSTSFSIYTRAAILGLSSILLVASLVGNRVKVTAGFFWIPLSVFWVAYLLRIYIDTSSDLRALSRSDADYWIWAVGACLIPMLGLLTHLKRAYFTDSYPLALSLLILASFLAALLGSGTYTPEHGTGYDSGRLQLESLNPISVGHLGLSLLLLSIWPFIHEGKPSWRPTQITNVAAGLLGLYLLIASASRGPLVTLIFVLFFYFISQDLKRGWRVLAAVATILFLINLVGTYLEEAGTYRVFSRAESALSGEDAAVAGRQVAYKGALEQFVENPFFGDSLEERTTRLYPHNTLLESFMATGLIGGASFAILISYGFFAAYNVVKSRGSDGWISLIFIQYALGAQFSGALYTATTMWTFLALTIVLHHTSKRTTIKPERQAAVE